MNNPPTSAELYQTKGDHNASPTVYPDLDNASNPPPYVSVSGSGISDYSQQQGYPQQNTQPGYPPQSQFGYPPQVQPGYPPQCQPGYPSPGQPSYPSQSFSQGQSNYPQAGYVAQPGYPSQGATIVVTQPGTIVQATTIVQPRDSPINMVCPRCRANITTEVTFDTGSCTWIACFLLCIVGCDLGCCLIPFCADGCKDAVHYCPNCKQMVSRWNRL